jgi:uncharacterized protein (TIGR03435 family)
MALHAFVFAHFHAQPVRPEFEVASVRLTPPRQEHGMALGLRLEASQVRVVAMPLRDIIATAYRVKSYQIAGPDWITTTQFDINAKLPAGNTADTAAKVRQIPEMLQALLGDRFGLAFHRSPKELTIYALIAGKPPLKLLAHASTPATAGDSADTLTWNLSGSPAGISNNRGDGSSYSFTAGKFEGKKLSASAFAAEIERYSARPIVDMTQLTGLYDVSFTVSAEAYGQLLARAALNSGMVMPPQAMRTLENADFNYLPEAVEHLGLKLESRRMPIDVITIDQVRRTPTDN